MTRRKPKDYPLVKAGVTVGELPVTHISYFVPLTKRERIARVRSLRAQRILEDEAIEAAIDDYVKEHAEGWAQYVPPSFDDDPPEAA